MRLMYKIVLLMVVVIPFVATVLAITLLWQRAVHWSDLLLLAIMYTLVKLAENIGFHRMLAHRSFRPHPAVKLILLVLASMSFQGPAMRWVAIHIKHHAQTDQEGDPHSPLEGLFHAHLGWFFKGDGFLQADPHTYCRHLYKDRIVVFVNDTTPFWMFLALLIPFLVGGWTGLLWGGLVRIFLTHHTMWSINSVCHTLGKREFETGDRSHNEWIVGLLAFGEGWHNNHHAFPRSAFHGLHWWQFDLCAYVIWLLERCQLVSDVYRVPPLLRQRRSLLNAQPGKGTAAGVISSAAGVDTAEQDW